MERFNANIGSLKAALHKTPEVFEAIGMNPTANIFDGMVNDLVHVFFLKAIVGSQRVAVDGGPSRDICFDQTVKGTALAVLNHGGANFPAALKNSHDCGFVFSASSLDSAFAFFLVHVAGKSTDESFVNFDFAGQFGNASFLKGKPDAVKHEPRAFLGYADGPANLMAGYSVLAVLNHPHCGEPLIEAKGGILKDGSNLDGKLAPGMPDAALPSQLVLEKANLGASADRADNAILPFGAAHDEVFEAVRGAREKGNCLLQGLGFVVRLVFHAQIIPRIPVLVNYIIA